MIPILFPANYIHDHGSFSGHGIGDLVEAIEIEAEETSDEGHEWTLSFKYPYSGSLASQLVLNSIVVAKVNDYQPPQAFRVHTLSKSINQMIGVECQHISYDLKNVPVMPFEEIGAADVLAKMKANMVDNQSIESQATYGKKFIFSTDIPDPEHKSNPQSKAERESMTVSFDEPTNARAVLFDGDNSVHGRFGGDSVIDNFNIAFRQVGGEDRGVSIDYGVSLVDFDQERSINEMITGILPYFVKEKDVKITLQTTTTIPDGTPDFAGQKPVNMFNLDAPLVLDAGWNYELSFRPDAYAIGDTSTYYTGMLNSSLGLGAFTFNMDGSDQVYKFTLTNPVMIPANAILFYSAPDPDGNAAACASIGLRKNPVEPIVYGEIVTRSDAGYEYGVPKYEVPKIEPVNITDYFADPSEIPTSAQVTAKGQEYANHENIGVPTVSLTVSYADLDGREVHMYDAVRVRFVKMGVDVKSKVTRYKYDVLNERCIEIDVGKTKESALFTLLDAGRLTHGLLKPDRLAKESVDGSKLKKGSVGADAVDLSSRGGAWNWGSNYIDPEAYKDKIGTDDLKKGPAHKDAVLRKKPLTREDGYHRDVGYVFDPGLGVPPENLPGWRDKYDEFHSMAMHKATIGADLGHGYVLDPDFIFPESIDAEQKVKEKSVKAKNIDNGAITADKVANGAIEAAIYAHNSERKMKAWLDLYDGVGAEGIPIADNNTVQIQYLRVTKAFSINSYNGVKPTLNMAYDAYTADSFQPADFSVDGSFVARVLTKNGVDIDVEMPRLYAKTVTVITDVSVNFDTKTVTPTTKTINYYSPYQYG